MAHTRPSLLQIVAAVLFATSVAASACQVPVFRYALERWAPANYLLSITPSEGGLTDAEKKAVELLRAAPRDAANPVNFEVQIASPAAGARGPAQLALEYPRKLRDAGGQPIWNAPLTDQNVKLLLDSPVRRELRSRLLAGESAIWVLVESGDAAKDAAAVDSVTRSLALAESSLKLPDPSAAPGAAANTSGPRANEQAEVLRTDLPLKIGFSLLRIQRTDPAEAVLLAMLTHVESDLGDFAGEPMAFPVFGRARVLEPLIGAGITQDNVLEHAGYLCGACSCEVKEQNPGIDLLFAANWEPVDTTPQLEIIRISPQTVAPPARKFPIISVGAGAGVIVLGLAAWILLRRASAG